MVSFSQFKTLDSFIGEIIENRSKEATIEQIIRAVIPPLNNVRPNNNYILDSNGIFIKDNQKKYRSYLFLERYNTQKYKKDYEKYRLPSKHLFFCETVRKYRNFVFSNQEEVEIYCKDQDLFLRGLHKLPVCKNCNELYKAKLGVSLYGKSMNEIILDFEENEQTRNIKIGLGGYVTNWNEISTAYRAIKNYTCEECQFQMTDKNGYQYIHVHHIKRREKTNNKRNNLKCLCIECHSQVDDVHRRNFSSPYEQRQIRKFIEKYKS